ncbi:MAG TPA: FAD-binding oxidoreductase [Thermohalobaculum sp.]|nr:FAD-binding oxidoreductase [Thermohalobaculum sp.]
METETLIIGGGLMGAWTAFFLSGWGHPVTVLEKSRVGAQASGVNYGNLRIQGRHASEYPLSLRAQEVWERIESTLGTTCEVQATGHIYVAQTQEQMEKLERVTAEAGEFGHPVELRNRAETLRVWPWLAGEVIGTSHAPRDCTANPRLVTPAVARAAAAQGAVFLEGIEVTDVSAVGEGFEVVTCAGERLRARHLVNAAGAWANEIAAKFGERVPMFAAGPPQFVTEALPHFIGPSMQQVDGRVICRQVARGNVVVAGYPRGPSDTVGNRAPVPPHKTLDTMRRLARLVPALAGAHVIRVWSGIEGYVSDMLPVLGRSMTVPNLIHAFGFCGHGFQLSPGVGIVVSELIMDGATPTPIEAFGAGRFTEADWAGLTSHADEFDPDLKIV